MYRSALAANPTRASRSTQGATATGPEGLAELTMDGEDKGAGLRRLGYAVEGPPHRATQLGQAERLGQEGEGLTAHAAPEEVALGVP